MHWLSFMLLLVCIMTISADMIGGGYFASDPGQGSMDTTTPELWPFLRGGFP
ncbi:unnamed protein product [Haemonchus placei]|uniref:Amelogenin n=1 Tax=Haemonchus placei TaxID=6290 RepID=A0A0N4WU35_HAEPC|nr:unnamed protein product [Haemonchus placei]